MYDANVERKVNYKYSKIKTLRAVLGLNIQWIKDY